MEKYTDSSILTTQSHQILRLPKFIYNLIVFTCNLDHIAANIILYHHFPTSLLRS
jgi:hypothetical protein